MESQEKMTVEQVLEITVRILGEIRVPVALDDISDPIKAARSNLQECLRAIAEEKARANGVEVVPLELVPEAPAEDAPEDGMFGEEAGPEVEPEG